jgi:hypothetical protein
MAAANQPTVVEPDPELEAALTSAGSLISRTSSRIADQL